MTEGRWIVRRGVHSLPEVWNEAGTECVADRVFNGNEVAIASLPAVLANLEQMERIVAQYLSGALVTFPASVLPQARAAIALARGTHTK